MQQLFALREITRTSRYVKDPNAALGGRLGLLGWLDSENKPVTP